LQKRKQKPKLKKGENHESIFNYLFGEFTNHGVVFHLHVKQDREKRKGHYSIAFVVARG
jgi:hypothetical protein